MTVLIDEEWFTLDSIELNTVDNDTLYCLAVDSPSKQFLVGSLNVPTHNTDEGKVEDELKGEAAMIIGSIARLGRAAGVHLIIATQRPDAKLINGETKANLGVRINCGRTNPTASSMILDNGEGAKVKGSPRGRLYLQLHGIGDHCQGFFAQQSWIDEYLASIGKNPDGSPLHNSNIQDNNELSDNVEDNNELNDNVEDNNDLSDNSNMDDDKSFLSENQTRNSDGSVTVKHEGFADLTLGGSTDNADQFHRPEDDWDSDLDDLISMNEDDDE